MKLSTFPAVLQNVVMAGKLYAQFCLQAIWLSVLAGTTSGICRFRKQTNWCSDHEHNYLYQKNADRLKACSILTYYNKPLQTNTWHFSAVSQYATSFIHHFISITFKFSHGQAFFISFSHRTRSHFEMLSCALKTLTSSWIMKFKFVYINKVYILIQWQMVTPLDASSAIEYIYNRTYETGHILQDGNS